MFTTLILAETYAYFSRSPVIRCQILDDAQRNPALHWEPVSASDEAAGISLLREHRDKNYSLADAVSFAVMRRLEVNRAASLDEQFRQFGIIEVVP